MPSKQTGERKTMRRIGSQICAGTDQKLQYVVSDAQWDHRELLADLATKANERIGGRADAALLISEAVYIKKGTKSVGVTRQEDSRTGRRENCQVALYSCLGCSDSVLPAGMRLFLPEEWIKDLGRMNAAKIPEVSRYAESKTGIAEELVTEARDLGLDFKWVSLGKSLDVSWATLARLDDAGEVFVYDIDHRKSLIDPSSNQRVPAWSLIRKRFPREDFTTWPELDRSRAGDRVYGTAIETDIPVPDRNGEFTRWMLLASSYPGEPICLSITNAQASVGLERLVTMQRQRSRMEVDFEDGRRACGMGQFAVRSWPGWHHHMALSMLGMFLLRSEMKGFSRSPLRQYVMVEELLQPFFNFRADDRWTQSGESMPGLTN